MPTASFPRNLWLYTNFDCNLSCRYCVAESAPRAITLVTARLEGAASPRDEFT